MNFHITINELRLTGNGFRGVDPIELGGLLNEAIASLLGDCGGVSGGKGAGPPVPADEPLHNYLARDIATSIQGAMPKPVAHRSGFSAMAITRDESAVSGLRGSHD